jgi:hypothetical protein
MNFIKLFLAKLRLFPALIIYTFYDWLIYKAYHKDKLFYGWGIHLFTGKFGAGKTSLMVIKAYELCKKYPQLSVITNVNLMNFPDHTRIIKLNTVDDILEAPENSLVLIDEIGTIFNSRDFMSGKKSVPKALFQHLAQCRHRKMMIFGSVQRFLLLDKQIRDISATVTECRTSFKHPFSRMITGILYSIDEYEAYVQNALYVPRSSDFSVYIQTEKYRHLYDTMEMVQGMLEMKYYSDEEILRNQGVEPMFIDGSREAQKQYKKARRRRR